MWQSFCNYNIICLRQSNEPGGAPGFSLDKPGFSLDKPGFSLDKNIALLQPFILLRNETCH